MPDATAFSSVPAIASKEISRRSRVSVSPRVRASARTNFSSSPALRGGVGCTSANLDAEMRGLDSLKQPPLYGLIDRVLEEAPFDVHAEAIVDRFWNRRYRDSLKYSNVDRIEIFTM